MEALLGWIEKRIPAMNAYRKHMSEYPQPKNSNFWYIFGALAMLVLVNQIVTGIWLTMNYVPSAEGAFASVEYIMRDVEYGWLLRYMHSTAHLSSLSLFICTCSVVLSTVLIRSRVS
ncbi:ubiquinol-cytochrome C reductase [Vibrio ishigakensis]|uniref:Ubiquinol-cytochrome C reductase n=1 Tax=Vibrio ishigakensis TaxID=1481914 RepID=A0A0B8NHD0_9VIBR|nr:ubiquinol-cytochrome C reductase [Vibrio ishigakensis]